MQENDAWYSASELAGLPGMPGTVRGVNKSSKDWVSRARAGRGGGREYSLSALPAETQTALAERAAAQMLATSDPAKAGAMVAARLDLQEQVAADTIKQRRLNSLKQSISLPEPAQQRLDAKLAILRAREIFQQAHGLSVKDSEHQFAAAYNSGEIAIAKWVHGSIVDISARSLRRWRIAAKTEGLTKLAGSYGNRHGSGKIDTQLELQELIIGMLVSKPHCRAAHIMQALRARFDQTTNIELPSQRALERWIDAWKAANAQVFTAIASPDAWKNRYMSSQGSCSEDIFRLNQRWELDSTPADVLLTDGRHSVLGVIDVYARRGKLLVSKTSKATAIATLVRHALLEWGVPEEAKTDRGQDYISRHVTRVFDSLDVKHSLCEPFQPWGKPHIERFFGTFTRDLVELLDGFIGHSVADRKSIEARKSFADRLMKRGEVVEITLSSVEFQAFCDRWCDEIYLHNPHRQLGNKTPFEMIAAWREPIRRIDDERALDILLAEAPDRGGMRTVQKNGIALENTWFISHDLGPYVGQQVQVRFDPQDLGRIYVFGGPDLQFICIAQAPERTGISRQEVAIRAKAHQIKAVQDGRRALKQIARKAGTDEIVAEILRDRADAARNVLMFPQRTEQHQSAGLDAAADAAAALTRPARSTAELMSNDAFDRARADIEARQKTPVQPLFNTPFERAYWIVEQSRERELSGEEAEYLAQFRRDNPKGARGIDELISARYDRAVSST